jgi:large subunit ribosomal protein L25
MVNLMDLTLIAETGRPPGSRAAGRLRAEGKVPGVVYGMGSEPVAVAVKWTELRRVLTTDAGLNALIALDIDGKKDFTIVKDLQRDPVRRDVLHIDFFRVDPDVLVEVEVPIVTIGEAKEVDNAKGIAEQQMKSLTVMAKPTGIPGSIEADITDLTVGTSITVGDLVLPDGVTTEVDPSTTVIAGVATRFSAADEGLPVEGEGEEGGEGEAGGDGAEASSDEASE